MASMIGRQAVVVGAGMAGLTFARVLADHFERVLVLDGDVLPRAPADRAGVPQGKHVHILLAGGERALGDLFPGFAARLAGTGAVPLRIGLDLLMERPGYDPFPQRDLGLIAYGMSRAHIEWTVRQLVTGCGNVEIREQCRVQELVTRPDGAAVAGVRWLGPTSTAERIDADLAVDASGLGRLTLDVLAATGRPQPDDTTIGVDLGYSTAIFEVPDDPPAGWKSVFTFPNAPATSRAALLSPIEGGRWILTVAGRHGETPPGDAHGFLDCVRQLRTPTIHDAVRRARRLGDIARFRFSESRRRHYERLDAFPRGLLPVGDAVCRFNPIYGQGMSVAAQEARALGQLLTARAGDRDPLDKLAPAFFAEAQALTETPWANAVVPDFVYPDTRGDRPAGLEQFLAFGAALTKLAARDAAVHTLVAEVQHLLKPRSVYQDPDLVGKVFTVMAEG